MEDIGKGDLGVVGDRLCQLVDVGERHVVHSGDLLDRRLRLHRAERQDLADLVRAVFARDVFDDLASPLVTEVDVKVGRRLAFGVEEALKEQVVFERVYVGDADSIRYDAAHARTSARADGDAVRARVVDEVPDDEVVVREALGDDDFELALRPLSDLGSDRAVPPLQALVRHAAQIVGRRRAVLGDVRRLKVLLFDDDVALFHHLDGVGDRLGAPRKGLHHLLVRFEVELICLEAHALGVVDRLARLDAEHDVVHLGVLALGVVDVVGRDDLDAYLPRDLDQQRVDPPLLLYAVVLEFDIEVPRREHVAQHDRIVFRLVVVVFEQQFGDAPRKAGGQTDHALGVFFERLDVYARLVVKAVDVRHAVQLNEIAIADVVFCNEHKVIEAAVAPRLLVHVLAGVELAADDGFEPRLLHRLVEGEHAEHVAVIGDRHAGHPLFDRLVDEGVVLVVGRDEPRRPVQQTELGVDVQMHERLDGRTRLLGLFLLLLFLFGRLLFLLRLFAGGVLLLELFEQSLVVRLDVDDLFDVICHFPPPSKFSLSCG